MKVYLPPIPGACPTSVKYACIDLLQRSHHLSSFCLETPKLLQVFVFRTYSIVPAEEKDRSASFHKFVPTSGLATSSQGTQTTKGAARWRFCGPSTSGVPSIPRCTLDLLSLL